MNRLHKAKENGEVDMDMLPLVNHVNSLGDFYTTSSCSGRITLFHDLGSKLEDDWVGKWHREIEFEEVENVMKNPPPHGIVRFMHDPAIIHIVSKKLDGAINLLNIARESGFKGAGILSVKEERILVEIKSTERIDAPVASDGKILVDMEYLRYMVNLANSKFRKGREKLKRLEENLMCQVLSQSQE